MRILIEASEAYRNYGGIGRFSRSLIAHLPDGLNITYSPSNYANRTHLTGQRTSFHRLSHFFEHLLLTQMKPLRAARSADLVHCLSFFGPLAVKKRPIVCTIFDMAYFDLPQQTDSFWGSYARRMMPIFAAKAAAVVTISQVSKTRIHAHLGLPLEKIHCIYPGVSFKPTPSDSIRHKYRLPERFALYSGSWAASKNLETLIRAASLYQIPVVMTGTAHSAATDVTRLAHELAAPITFVGHVSDTDLAALYTQARVLVLPSWYEGFGLPLLEAIACGTPVIAADIPVLREIGKDNVFYFPPAEVDALGTAIKTLFADDNLWRTYRAKGCDHAAGFRWEQTAQQMVELWHSLV